MFWMLPAVVGTVTGLATAGANIVANAQTGNTQRIRDLKRAQASGDVITADARRNIDQATEIARRGAQQVSEDAARRAAMSGATSGVDAMAIQEGQRRVTQDLFDKTADAFQAARVGEEQELEDRKALRRQRTVDTINSALKSGTQAAGAVSQMQGLTYQGKKYDKEPDWTALTKSGVDPTTVDLLQKVWKHYDGGMMSQEKRRQYEEMLSQALAGSSTIPPAP